MTDGYLMDADCIHGVVWFECKECEANDPVAVYLCVFEEPEERKGQK